MIKRLQLLVSSCQLKRKNRKRMKLQKVKQNTMTRKRILLIRKKSHKKKPIKFNKILQLPFLKLQKTKRQLMHNPLPMLSKNQMKKNLMGIILSTTMKKVDTSGVKKDLIGSSMMMRIERRMKKDSHRLIHHSH